jgi:hypothetical protein
MSEGAGTWNRNGGNAMKRFTLALVLITWAGSGLDFEPEPEIVYIGGEYDAYQQTEENYADVVIVVEFLPPSWTETDTRRVPLKRNVSARNRRMWVSNGWAACGGGGGYGGGLSIRNHGDDTREIEVSVSVSWRNDKSHGEFEHRMVAPWNGDVTQTIDPQSWMRVSFDRPKRDAKALDQGGASGHKLGDTLCDQQ